MDPAGSTQAVQLEPYIDPQDERFVVFPNGKRLARVQGGDGEGDPGGAVAGAPENGGEGQGGLGDLYDLSAVPEEVRPYVEEQVKQINSNVEGKFREHADFRKTWEPFGQVEGLTDVPPEELRELVAFREILGDEEALEDWWNTLGEKAGFFEEDEGGEGEELEGEGDEPPPWAQNLMERIEGLEGGLKPVQEHLTQSQRESAQNAAAQQIVNDVAALEKKHGELDDDAKEAILKLARAYDGAEDSIPRAFEDYLKITGQAQGELADSKHDQPGPAVETGNPSTEADEFSGLGDPNLKRAARERFAGQR